MCCIQNVYPSCWIKHSSCLNTKIQFFHTIYWEILQFLFNAAPSTLCVLWFLFFSPALSIPSSLEQGCFLFLLSPKPFSFGWSVKDSDNQRGEARRPAGEGAQEAGQIYWAASGRRTIRQGRAMPHRAGRSGKDFSLYLILMSMFVCRYVACTVWDKTVWRL